LATSRCVETGGPRPAFVPRRVFGGPQRFRDRVYPISAARRWLFRHQRRRCFGLSATVPVGTSSLPLGESSRSYTRRAQASDVVRRQRRLTFVFGKGACRAFRPDRRRDWADPLTRRLPQLRTVGGLSLRIAATSATVGNSSRSTAKT
jgi:hypothetical protein